jgi:hypothetical protein
MNATEPIGLVAGAGRFPFAFAIKARETNQQVVCAALKGMADPKLAHEVDSFDWYGVGRLGGMISYFKRKGVRKLVLCGKVFKADIIFDPWMVWSLLPDWRTFRAWFLSGRRDNKDDTVLSAVIAEFAADGITVSSALELCPELLVKPAILTRRTPTAGENADIRFGWDIARQMGGLDIGQSVVVKDRVILAVEAVEGTDRSIVRAGELCRKGGFTVVKVAKPEQDMRFDVPTIGCTTIETIHRAGGRVLAIEAKRTIVLDQDEVVTLANRLGITIVAMTEDDLKNS